MAEEERAIYAWVEVEPDGREGVIASNHPMVAQIFAGIAAVMTVQHRNYEVALRLRPIALAHARASGRAVRLVKFVRAEQLEEIKP